MFDLDLIEQDYLKNYSRLSEKEIIKIYQSEGATLSANKSELDDYRRKINKYYLTPEERLFISVFGLNKEIEKKNEQYQKLVESIPKPQEKHLSKESQRKVVEGCLYLVFDSTREWYQFFKGKLSMEKIYYICLESLINSVKYAVHNEKPFFKFYILKSIERGIINYISRKEHIDYRDAYKIIHYHKQHANEDIKLSLSYEDKEEVEKPSKIFYRLRKDYYDIDYLKDISSNQFLNDYNLALEDILNQDERWVMILSYDDDGYRRLTINEIADCMGIDSMDVIKYKKSAIKKLRKDERIINYM